LRKAASSLVMSVRPYGTTRLPLDGFSLNLILGGSYFFFRKSIENSYQKIQQDATVYQNLFRIYMKLNMFRATHRPSSGA